ncbi:MAG: cyclase family protein [Proteobacteria bacterium]|nr:cyclase family protein [Pseudomonadota bacterium]
MIIDISPLLSSDTAVWPGDTPLSRHVLCDILKDSHLDLSSLTSTVHLGAHADAPRHYSKQGNTIDKVDLNSYLGPCYVHSVVGVSSINPGHLNELDLSKIERILFRTLSQTDSSVFNTDFTSIAPETIELLGLHKVKLIGIDTQSIDPFDSKTLSAHKSLEVYKIANIEGLVLTEVKDGFYEFIGLPLKLEGFDGSPIRAVLRSL